MHNEAGKKRAVSYQPKRVSSVQDRSSITSKLEFSACTNIPCTHSFPSFPHNNAAARRPPRHSIHARIKIRLAARGPSGRSPPIISACTETRGFCMGERGGGGGTIRKRSSRGDKPAVRHPPVYERDA